MYTHSVLLAPAETATSLSSEREPAMWMIEGPTDGDAELHAHGDVIPETENRTGEGMTYAVVITKLPLP
jgi:hypothetical protein